MQFRYHSTIPLKPRFKFLGIGRLTGWGEWGQHQYQKGPQSVPRRRALTSLLLGVASSNFSGAIVLCPSFLYGILPQICGIVAFPLKVFTKKCWCWKGRFVFVHSNIQAVKWLSTKRWLLWPAALLLCCRFGFCSSPQLAVFRTLRSLTRFKSPSSTSLGPVFCCSMQQNKIKVTCIYICRWSLY